MKKKKAEHYRGPIAEFIYSDGSYRKIEYPSNPVGLSQYSSKTGKLERPTQLIIHPPENGWEEARAFEDNPVNQAYLGRWKDRCHEALMKGK